MMPGLMFTVNAPLTVYVFPPLAADPPPATLPVLLLVWSSNWRVVASTLAIAALFGPLRTRVQAFIDQRFFRRKYNAAQVVGAFAHRAQNEAGLDALAADTLGVVRETLEPEAVRLWLVR